MLFSKSQTNSKIFLNCQLKTIALFLFCDLYDQIDGMAMDSPLGLSLAYIFMNTSKQNMYQIDYYCRYICDIFLNNILIFLSPRNLKRTIRYHFLMFSSLMKALTASQQARILKKILLVFKLILLAWHLIKLKF